MTQVELPAPTDAALLGAHVRDGGTAFGIWVCWLVAC